VPLFVFLVGVEFFGRVLKLNAGLAYANGHGVPVDVTAAADLYRRACDAGHAGGCINVGYDCENGTGVAQSWDQALAMFTKGCSFSTHRMAQRACNDAKRLGEVRRDGARPVGSVVLPVDQHDVGGRRRNDDLGPVGDGGRRRRVREILTAVPAREPL